jgi:predicted permease
MAALLTLALGIGANTAVFSIVYAVLLKPLPFDEPDRLVSVVEARQGLPARTSDTSFAAWRDTSKTIEHLAVYREERFTITGVGEPEFATTCPVSDEFFTTLGAPPLAGRVVGPGDRDQPVAVLAYGFWRRRFGPGENALGLTLTLDGRPHTIIGVMPAAFAFPSPDVAAWVPRRAVPGEMRQPGFRQYRLIGRLKDEATLNQARTEAPLIASGLETWDKFSRGVTASVRPLEDEIVGDVRTGLLALLAVAGLVLLLASINVGSLCLARAAARRGDTAVRAALGASRCRLVRHVLAESVVIGAAGALAGVLLAAWAASGIVRVVAPDTPRIAEVAISPAVLAFAIVVSAFSVLVAGLLPAWQAARQSAREPLAEDGGGTRLRVRTGRLRFTLVAVQTTLSTIVLVTALLFARTLNTLLQVESDRPAKDVLTVAVTLPAPAYANCYRNAACEAREAAFISSVLERLTRVRGVDSAGVSTSLPPHISEMLFTAPVRNPDTGADEPYTVNIVAVGGRYFEALGIRCVQGRLFDERDGANAPAVFVVGRDFARRRFGSDPLGRQLPFGPPDPQGRPTQATVIGVVDDVRYGGLDKPADGAIYLPYAQAPTGTFYAVVKTSGSPWRVARQVRDEIRAVDPLVPLGQAVTLNQLRHASVAQPEARAILLGCLAALARVLACVGLYGNGSCTTTSRAFEVGVRMALGADRRAVYWLLARSGMAPVALGLAAGLAGAAALSRVVARLLFGVRPIDPFTFAAVPALLLFIAWAAISVPALRATRMNPAATLGGRR